MDDLTEEGLHQETILHTVESTDQAYDGMPVESLTVYINNSELNQPLPTTAGPLDVQLAPLNDDAFVDMLVLGADCQITVAFNGGDNTGAALQNTRPFPEDGILRRFGGRWSGQPVCPEADLRFRHHDVNDLGALGTQNLSQMIELDTPGQRVESEGFLDCRSGTLVAVNVELDAVRGQGMLRQGICLFTEVFK